MGPDQAFAELLRGKRVVLVGPSSAYENSRKGEEIDKFDIVVRLNWGCPVPEPLKRDLGSRTDVLYKRLLHSAYPSVQDLKAWAQEGVRFVVIGDATLQTPNARAFAMLNGRAGAGGIPWTLTGQLRTKMIQETHTSPLIGPMAVAHLLQQPLASLDVWNCDFYAGGYQAGYGGRDYRRSRGRPEGVPGDSHKVEPQLRYLGQLQAVDSRLRFDETLGRLVREAVLGGGLGAQVIIPARWASSRFPGKALAPIAGVPMILRTLERVATFARNPIVATDDQRIVDVVRQAGYRVEMTHDALTGTDRVAQLAATLKTEIFVNVQGDEPLVDPGALLALVQAKRLRPGMVINAMSRLNGKSSDPTIVKAAVAPDGRLLYASRAAIPSTKDGPAAMWRQMGLYAYNARELARFAAAGARTPLEELEDVEILRFLELGVPVQMIEVREGGPAVDLPEHIAAVEEALELLRLEEAGEAVPV